jgi:hypothetical protein
VFASSSPEIKGAVRRAEGYDVSTYDTFYLFIFYIDSSSVVTEPWLTSLQLDVFNPGIKFGTIASARAFVAHVKTTTPSNVTQSRSESGEFSRNAFR